MFGCEMEVSSALTPTITRFDLTYCVSSSGILDGLTVALKSQKLRNLTNISLITVPGIENSFDFFRSLPQGLSLFQAKDCSLSPDSIQILSAHIHERDNLEYLELSDNPHVGAAEHLFSSLPRKLVNLNLVNCCLTENSMAVLLSNMPQQLKYLYIGRIKLSAEAAKQFRNIIFQFRFIVQICVDEPVDLSPRFVQKMRKMSTIVWSPRGSDFDMELAVSFLDGGDGWSVVDNTSSET